ncbi:MAG: hypothetical protein WCV59_04160 [Parcubacteria group bacterium]
MKKPEEEQCKLSTESQKRMRRIAQKEGKKSACELCIHREKCKK